MVDHRICVAPMMDYTDRHCRYFLRLISRNILLYTEMITANAILHGDQKYLLDYDKSEHPLALQLGGSDPENLAQCALIAEKFGYDEINLNVGCPSDHVTVGHFGACLMKEPKLVARCVAAMQAKTKLPVTVKSRIGVDEQDSYEELQNFVKIIADAGCEVFIVHARKAWLKGLSPKENREIPPLRYEWVYQLKKDFPHLTFVINGGIKSFAEARMQLNFVDGVMIGREAYHNPYLLAAVDREFFNDAHPIPSRAEILEKFIPYVEQQLQRGAHLSQLTHHILGLFQGLPGARAWRRYLSENAHKKAAGVEVIKAALQLVKKGEQHGNS